VEGTAGLEDCDRRWDTTEYREGGRLMVASLVSIVLSSSGMFCLQTVRLCYREVLWREKLPN
jgi:hypothetical protein